LQINVAIKIYCRWTIVATTMKRDKQEAQLPQRNSASAAHMEGGWG